MSAQRGGRNSTARSEKRHEVRLPDGLEPGDGTLDSGASLERVAISGGPGPDDDVLSDVELTDVRWSGGRLTGQHFRRLRCTNVVFDNCDLSGLIAQDSRLHRVEFRECRMSGVVFAGSELRDVLFSASKLDSANLRMTSGGRVHVLGSDLREADFYAAALGASRIQDSNLSAVEFSESVLDGVRLHGSVLRDLKGVSALRSAVISEDQVWEMSVALFAESGIAVDEDRGGPSA